MATIYAGKGKVNSYNPYISLTVAKSSQSIDGNYTIVDFALKLHRPSEVISSTSKDYSFKINGTTYSGTYTIGGSGTKTIRSGTQKIAHNSDGSKSISYSMSVEIAVTWGSTYIGTVSNSSTLSLPTIPRATTLTIGLTGDKVYMGDSIDMSMIRASSSFTHDLAYSFAGGSYVSIATGVGESKTWTTPDLASKVPSATSGTLKVRCITKKGSTTIGTTYASITLYVPTSVVPTVSALTATEATSGLAAQFGAFIQGKSKISCKITGEGAKGSTIKEYQATFAGSSYTTSSWTSPVLATSGTLTIKARVKDSRGRWSSYKTLDVTVLAYAKPAINLFEVERCDADGAENTAGEYLSIRYKYSVTSLGSKNTASMTVSYKLASASNYTALLTNTALSADKTVVPTKVFSNSDTFDLKMEVTDWFGVTPYTTAFAIVPTEEVIFDIKADGLGFSVGGVATQSRVMDSFWQVRPQAGMYYETLETGTNLNNLKEANVYRLAEANTYVNGPTGDPGGILEVYSFADCDVVMQRLNVVYSGRGVQCTRFFFDGAWTAWRNPHKWTLIKPTAASVVTTNSLSIHYNEDLELVTMRGSVTIKPTAAVSEGAAINLGTVPENLRPGYTVSLSVYRASTGTGWAKASLDTDGVIWLRPGGALTANASATYYMSCTYYNDF